MFDKISKFWWPITHDPRDLETQNLLGGDRVHRVTRMPNLSKIGEVMVNMPRWSVVELPNKDVASKLIITRAPKWDRYAWFIIAVLTACIRD